MNNLPILVQGELQRMRRYHILTGSFAVALIWVGALMLVDSSMLLAMFTTLLYVDTVAMPILLVGVSLLFERQEGALKAILVAPVSHASYITAKILVLMISGLMTLLVLGLYMSVLRAEAVHWAPLILTIILTAGFHTLLGFLAVYHSRDFTSLLMKIMAYMLIFLLPVLLSQWNLLTQPFLTGLLYVLPTQASYSAVYHAVNGSFNGSYMYGVLYLIGVGTLLFWLVQRGFGSFAEKESGV